MRGFRTAVVFVGCAMLLAVPVPGASANRQATCTVTEGSIVVSPPLRTGVLASGGYTIRVTSVCLNSGGSIGFPTFTGSGTIVDGTCGTWSGSGTLDGHSYSHVLAGSEWTLIPTWFTGSLAGVLTVVPEPNLAGEDCVTGTSRFRILGGAVTFT